MFDRLLVPTDGSDAVERSVRRAGVLAETYDAAVHLLHVVDSMTLHLAGNDEMPNGVARQGAVGGAADVLTERADRLLSETAARLDDFDVPVRTAIRCGPPAESIGAYAEEADIDLTIVTDRGRNRVEQFFLGSIPVRLFRRTTLPLWVSKVKNDRPATTVEDVVLPVDGSSITTRTARYAGAIAGQFDAMLHLVSVVDKRRVDVGPVYEQLEAANCEALSAAAEAVPTQVDVTTELRRGKPSKQVVAHAQEVGSDLLSMGVHRQKGSAGFLTVPVAERILRRLDRPVMALRALPGSA